jgi:hypothetical protein
MTGRELISDIRYMLIDFDSQDAENKDALREEIRRRIKQIGKLEEDMLVVTASVDFHLVTPVYAQSPMPSWISQPPRDQVNFYFVGVGNSSSLDRAKEASFNDALEQAVQQVVVLLNNQTAKVSGFHSVHEYTKKSVETAETYLSYNRKTGDYQYFTLLKLNRKFANPAYFKLFAPQAVVSKTTVEQRHLVILNDEFQAKVALYVGDIHRSGPFTLIVFERGPETTAWQETTSLTAQEIRKKVPPAKKLFDGEIDPAKPEVNFVYNGQDYILTGVLRTSTFKADYLDFEVFRN